MTTCSRTARTARPGRTARLARAAVATLAAAGVTTALAASATAAGTATPSPTPSPASVADLQHAAVTEAFAYGQYRAYATQADLEHDTVAAAAWRTIADVEYHDHFVKEGELSGLVGTDSENLAAALRSEQRAAGSYSRWIRDAEAARCGRVAKALGEIRADEVDHARLLRAAIAAGSDADVPAGPTSTPVGTRRTSPACADATVAADLAAAMDDEATARAQYDQWADHAANSGHPRLAALFAAIGAVELDEHFATESRLAGLVGDTRSNLAASVASERDAIAMYTADAAAATQRGETPVADLFTEVRGDEQGHLASFQALAQR